MNNSALTSSSSAGQQRPAVSLSDLDLNAQGWLLDGELRLHSKDTLALRRTILDKLLWFLRQHEHASCGTSELKLFLAYLSRGHERPGGRWGNDQLTRQVRPSTVQTYHRHLRTFFRWLVSEGVIDASPMDGVAAPLARPDQVQPFAMEQVKALLTAAKRTKNPRRDEALVLFLLDTGVRASELCSLVVKDVDMQGRRCSVLGKGNKYRTVYFGGATAKAIWQYLRSDPREVVEPLFLSERGEAFTRSGLRQLIERLGDLARIEAARCSPHTFRHTFAVEFLRAGGNVFTLQQLLGHTDLKTSNRYVALAQADIQNQHRQFSPADRLKGRGG